MRHLAHKFNLLIVVTPQKRTDTKFFLEIANDFVDNEKRRRKPLKSLLLLGQC